MRVMVLVKATDESEAGRMPTAAEIDEMGRFNARLVEAGVMLAGDGLASSREGKRIDFDGDAPVVLDGPFAETKELVSGFWIWQVSSMDEAVEWLRQAPFRQGTVELRRFHEPEDFGDAFTPERQALEDDLRGRIASQQQ
ncbi:MAG: YciI family protein [Jatrophihabitans sp.]|uniref:YciI family protein n=1 Tax=Jatrophihabitans sp. TaxID=1932789 RepID=UPI003F7D6634